MLSRKERKAVADRLRVVPIFSACTDDELAEIDSLMTQVDLQPGTKLTREGESGREFVIVLDGQAEVTKDGEYVACIGPGSFVGEIALLTKTPRTATVVALTPVRAFVLNQAEFQGLLDASPALREKIEKAAADRRG